MEKHIVPEDILKILKKLLTKENYYGKLIVGIRGSKIEYANPDQILKENDVEGFLDN